MKVLGGWLKPSELFDNLVHFDRLEAVEETEGFQMGLCRSNGVVVFGTWEDGQGKTSSWRQLVTLGAALPKVDPGRGKVDIIWG